MSARSAWLSWSSGKDAAWTLLRMKQDPSLRVTGLLTTVNATHGRVTMHATRERVLEAQARRIGLPLHKVALPWPCSNEIYESRMRRAMASALEAGVEQIAFGDLQLADVRAYRIEQFAGSGLEPVFPIWRQDTGALARGLVDAGFKAVLCCVDPAQLSPAFIGRTFDHALLEDLPAGVDPCGENGEFHTCVVDGPVFDEPLAVEAGDVVERDGFWFLDLVPAASGRPD